MADMMLKCVCSFHEQNDSLVRLREDKQTRCDTCALLIYEKYSQKFSPETCCLDFNHKTALLYCDHCKNPVLFHHCGTNYDDSEKKKEIFKCSKCKNLREFKFLNDKNYAQPTFAPCYTCGETHLIKLSINRCYYCDYCVLKTKKELTYINSLINYRSPFLKCMSSNHKDEFDESANNQVFAYEGKDRCLRCMKMFIESTEIDISSFAIKDMNSKNPCRNCKKCTDVRVCKNYISYCDSCILIKKENLETKLKNLLSLIKTSI